MIGHKLKRVQSEIELMSIDEFHSWIAYFLLQDDGYKQDVEAEISSETGKTIDKILEVYNKVIQPNGK